MNAQVSWAVHVKMTQVVPFLVVNAETTPVDAVQIMSMIETPAYFVSKKVKLLLCYPLD